MIVKDNITLYVCEHCARKMFRKHSMVNHEEKCDKNPKNVKACFGCVHLTTEEVEYEVEYYDGSDGRKSGCFKCEKLNKIMYSWKAEKLNLPEKYPETFDEQKPMPNTCRSRTEYDEEKYIEPFNLPF